MSKRQQHLPLGPTAGALLRAGRERAKMTREDLGAKLGLSKSTVAHVEDGYNAPNARDLAAWCRATNANLQQVCEALESRPPCK